MGSIITPNFGDGTDTIPSIYLTGGSAKYRANYDLSGTAAVVDSMNVASITDVGSGSTALGFTANFGNALYQTASSRRGDNTANGDYNESLQQKTALAYTTSSVGLLSGTLTASSGAVINIATNHSVGFGDLA